MTPEICPICGTVVPPNARSCPECGSDEESGWSDSARAEELGLPDEEFDYADYVKREFGGSPAAPATRGLHWFWWCVAVLLLAGLLAMWFF